MSLFPSTPQRHHLGIGKVFLSDKPAEIITVLGSCVAVAMYAPRLHIGGMCHGLLPDCPGPQTCGRTLDQCFQYVGCSVRLMVSWFEKRGVLPEELQVQLFGGASMFKRAPEIERLLAIGKKNIAAAGQALQQAGVQWRSVSIGGSAARRISFCTHTGEAIVEWSADRNGHHVLQA